MFLGSTLHFLSGYDSFVIEPALPRGATVGYRSSYPETAVRNDVCYSRSPLQDHGRADSQHHRQVRSRYPESVTSSHGNEQQQILNFQSGASGARLTRVCIKFRNIKEQVQQVNKYV